jgi:hypothetical protein
MVEIPDYNLQDEKPAECPECSYWGITLDMIPIWGTHFRWICDHCQNIWNTRISCAEATVLISNGKKFHTSRACAGSATEKPFLEVIEHREPCQNCVPRNYLDCYEEYS